MVYKLKPLKNFDEAEQYKVDRYVPPSDNQKKDYNDYIKRNINEVDDYQQSKMSCLTQPTVTSTKFKGTSIDLILPMTHGILFIGETNVLNTIMSRKLKV